MCCCRALARSRAVLGAASQKPIYSGRLPLRFGVGLKGKRNARQTTAEATSREPEKQKPILYFCTHTRKAKGSNSIRIPLSLSPHVRSYLEPHYWPPLLTSTHQSLPVVGMEAKLLLPAIPVIGAQVCARAEMISGRRDKRSQWVRCSHLAAARAQEAKASAGVQKAEIKSIVCQCEMDTTPAPHLARHCFALAHKRQIFIHRKHRNGAREMRFLCGPNGSHCARPSETVTTAKQAPQKAFKHRQQCVNNVACRGTGNKSAPTAREHKQNHLLGCGRRPAVFPRQLLFARRASVHHRWPRPRSIQIPPATAWAHLQPNGRPLRRASLAARCFHVTAPVHLPVCRRRRRRREDSDGPLFIHDNRKRPHARAKLKVPPRSAGRSLRRGIN